MKSIEHYESLARAGRAETCKHENAEHLRPGHAYDIRAPAHNQNVEQLRCLDCGAWLSLGRARDTKRVRIEIRAAEIAAMQDGRFETWQEASGWRAHANGRDPDADDPADWAGWLAREIEIERCTR